LSKRVKIFDFNTVNTMPISLFSDERIKESYFSYYRKDEEKIAVEKRCTHDKLS